MLDDYNAAVKIFLKLIPQFNNETYSRAKRLFDESLKERVGGTKRDAFRRHIESFYV